MDAPPGARLEVEALDRRLLDGVPAGHERRRVDVLVLPIFTDERPLVGFAGLVDWRASGRLTRLVLAGHLRGELGETLLTPGAATLPARRLVLIGAGASRDFDPSRAVELAECAVGVAGRLRPADLLMSVPCHMARREAAESFVSAVRDAAWRLEPAIEHVHELPPSAAGPTVVIGDRSAVSGDEEPMLRVVKPRRARPRWVLAVEATLLGRARRLLVGPPQAASSPG